MLIQFTVGNYLSFKDKVTLSMEATSIKENPENVFETPDGRYRLLKSVAIYGANASGKSNLIKAMGNMAQIIYNNIKSSSRDIFHDVIPFLLSTETENKPSFFEVIFLVEGIKYRYGFEIDINKINTEWLFETKKTMERPLFVRDGNEIDIFPSFAEGKGLEEKTSPNKLFLSVVDQFNGSISKNIMGWLKERTFHFSALDLELEEMKEISYKYLSDPFYKEQTSKLFGRLGLGFSDYEIIPNVDLNKPSKIKTNHSKYDKNLNKIGDVQMDLHSNESKGTNKLMDCSFVILEALKHGNILSLDELDASLHPLMTLAITKLYNSNENNPKNSQLIFTTHDTNLLSKGGFRRDQIYFVEKDNYEASHLYSLAEFREPDGKKVRKDRSFEEDYIQGRYGAIPFIGDFSKLLSNG